MTIQSKSKKGFAELVKEETHKSNQKVAQSSKRISKQKKNEKNDSQLYKKQKKDQQRPMTTAQPANKQNFRIIPIEISPMRNKKNVIPQKKQVIAPRIQSQTQSSQSFQASRYSKLKNQAVQKPVSILKPPSKRLIDTNQRKEDSIVEISDLHRLMTPRLTQSSTNQIIMEKKNVQSIMTPSFKAGQRLQKNQARNEIFESSSKSKKPSSAVNHPNSQSVQAVDILQVDQKKADNQDLNNKNEFKSFILNQQNSSKIIFDEFQKDFDLYSNKILEIQNFQSDFQQKYITFKDKLNQLYDPAKIQQIQDKQKQIPEIEKKQKNHVDDKNQRQSRNLSSEIQINSRITVPDQVKNKNQKTSIPKSPFKFGARAKSQVSCDLVTKEKVKPSKVQKSAKKQK